jgi:hypothetical protein
MKAISKTFRRLSVMNIESKLSRSVAPGIEHAIGGVHYRNVTGKPHGSNITAMRDIDAIGGSN